MTRPYVVNAFFYEKDGIWVGLSHDILGAAFETKTFSQLNELAQELGRDLIKANLSAMERVQFTDEIEVRIISLPPEYRER